MVLLDLGSFYVTHAASESNSSSRLGSGSKVVMSQVVVGPVASSALKAKQKQKSRSQNDQHGARSEDPHKQRQRIPRPLEAHPHPGPLIVFACSEKGVHRTARGTLIVVSLAVLISVSRTPPFSRYFSGSCGVRGWQRSGRAKDVQALNERIQRDLEGHALLLIHAILASCQLFVLQARLGWVRSLVWGGAWLVRGMSICILVEEFRIGVGRC